MTKYICSICGYKHEGDKAPGKCPVCLSPSSQFKLDNSEQEVAQDVENKDYANGNPRVAEIDSSIHEHLSSQSTGVEITAQTDKSEDGIETEYEQDMRYVSKEDEEQILEFGEAKLQAVKWYKEKHNCGLKEAKDFVDSVLEKGRKNMPDVDNEEESTFYTDDDKSGKETVPPVQKGQKSKKSCLTIIGIIALVLFIVGILNNNSSEVEQGNGVEVSDSVVIADTLAEEDIRSKEYVTKYLEETLNLAIKGNVEQALAKYFTKDFVNLYKEVEEIDNKNAEEIGFWDSDFWTGWQDGEIRSVKVLVIKDMTSQNATAIVQLFIKMGDYDESKISKEVKLQFKGDRWEIDDYDNYKRQFKNYIEVFNMQRVEITDSVSADSDIAE